MLAMQVTVRRLTEQDDLGELTKLLNRAYARLADMGLNFVATYQDEATTRRRIADAECFVAEADGKIVGTILLRLPGVSHGCDWYNQPNVAVFGQFGVEPDFQGHGIGSALLAHVEEKAKEAGATELALDTAKPATHLIELYQKKGFRIVDEVQWDITNYRSVIMSKDLDSDQ